MRKAIYFLQLDEIETKYFDDLAEAELYRYEHNILSEVEAIYYESD